VIQQVLYAIDITARPETLYSVYFAGRMRSNIPIPQRPRKPSNVLVDGLSCAVTVLVKSVLEDKIFTRERTTRHFVSFGQSYAAALACLFLLKRPNAADKHIRRHSKNIPDTETVIHREPQRFGVFAPAERE
jgi:hypothetical protein